MKRLLASIGLLALAVAWSVPAFGQAIATASVNGDVKDTTGAMIPGAEVVVTNPATGKTYTALSNESGLYVISGVPSGTYSVTVTAPGFKKAIYQNVKVDVGVPATVNAVMEVGQLTEQVVVLGGQEIVNTSSVAIGTTVDKRRVQELPLSSRDALDLTMLQAGVATTGNPRSSVVDGLRKASINITMDGVNIQDNNLRSSDGYFTYVRPRIDAVEEFTISTSTTGSESSGGGAVQIKFVTRAGTNQHHGSLYWYYRSPNFNANYYFNNNAGIERTRVFLRQFGVREGGPIIKNRLFYFANYEEFRLPDARARTRTILNNDAMVGNFVYKGTDGTNRTVNLLQLAGTKGYPSTIDPFMQKQYIDIIKANAKSGIETNDLRTSLWSFNNEGTQRRVFTTQRFDWTVTSKINWELIGNYNYFNSEPDFLNNYDRFSPGYDVQGSQRSNRWSASTAVRYQISPTITNETRYGMVGGTSQFARDIPIPAFRVTPPIISNPLAYQPSSSRNAPGFHIIDNISWAKGKHFWSFGTEVTFLRRWSETVSGTSQNNTLGLTSTDPANSAIFSSANFPSISSTDLDTARSLYALLIGRVSGAAASVYADENKLQFVVGAPFVDRYKQNEVGIFAQDSWRVRPSLTLSFGLRWEFLGVPDSLNKLAVVPVGGLAGTWGVSGYNNLFKPGTLSGSAVQLDLAGGIVGRPFYNNDWNNFSPSIGFNWQPEFGNKVLRALLGERGKSVIRGGYSVAYIRDGFYNTTLVTQGNAGTIASGNLVSDQDYKAGDLMLRNPMPPLRVNPSEFKFPTPQAPLAFANSVYSFNPDLRIPYVQSWSLGFEREIFKDTVLEFRYVGNHGTKLWRSVNINEINIFENGFLKEFQSAQNNLAISRAAGKGANFNNQGLTGQLPLPIFTAVFGSATSSNFSNTTYVNRLDEGQAGSLANTFSGNATFYNNLIKAYPTNFWKVNPESTGAYMATNMGDSNYHSMQIEFRRRMTKGIFTQVNYTFGKSLATDEGNSTGSNSFYTLRDLKRNYVRTSYDITQRVNVNFIWEPPVGTGRTHLNSGWVGKVFEGWQIGGIGRIQTGNPFELTSGRATFDQYESGVQLNGITRKQLQEKVGVRYDQANKRVYYFPTDLIASNGFANSTNLAPPTTPGQWGSRVWLSGPGFVRFDLSVVKKTYIKEAMNLELRAEFFDAFNNINFLTPAAGVLGTTFGRITSAYSDVSTTNDPGGRWIQFVARFNW
jgi:hypothetical protein